MPPRGMLVAVHARGPRHESRERRIHGRGRLYEVARGPQPADAGGESVGLRVDRAQVGAGRHEAPVRLACEGRGQRADEAVERGLVDEPLVGPVLADVLGRVQRRDVGRRRRWELRGELRDDAVAAQPREQRRPLGEALDERPPERVDEHGDDARRGVGAIGQHVLGQAVGAGVAEQPQQRAGDAREAVGVVEGPYAAASQARSGDRGERALVDHAGAAAARARRASIAARPSSPRSRVNSLT